ncbi:uncharacterized protein LOC106711497 [Papilio machaon]|uniref:uncharacterized protein LOC106711497 n=1 Tax=Papilio machaon TaxID=76193 RepID=UPI0006EAE5C7|nr:uncharacterized protein LOC106711497 [Papilio machaon]
MRQLFLSFLAILMFVLPSTKCSDLGRDGFNFYKDYARGRSDDNLPEEPLPEKMLYFYRTPVQLHSDVVPNDQQEYRKRRGNIFKSYMLNKDVGTDETRQKRSSKLLKSLMINSEQPYHITNNIFEEKMERTALQY